MRRDDERAHKVVIIPDCFLNPFRTIYKTIHEASSCMKLFVDAGYGVMMLPPPHVARSFADSMISQLAKDAVNYLQHDYQVVFVSYSVQPKMKEWEQLFMQEIQRWKPQHLVKMLNINDESDANKNIKAFLNIA